MTYSLYLHDDLEDRDVLKVGNKAWAQFTRDIHNGKWWNQHFPSVWASRVMHFIAGSAAALQSAKVVEDTRCAAVCAVLVVIQATILKCLIWAGHCIKHFTGILKILSM